MLSYFHSFFLFFLYAMISLCNDRNLSKDKVHFCLFWMTGTTFIIFLKIVFHSVQLRIRLIFSWRNIYLCHAVFSCCIQSSICCKTFKVCLTILHLKWNALSLYFYSENSFSKNIHKVIHLIFKNGINNIFPSQISFLLVSSETHTSLANKANQVLLS